MTSDDVFKMPPGREWSLDRLKRASIGARVGTYEAIPATAHEEAMKEEHPHLFKFEAISIGDDHGQAFFVPLDESSRETAELILQAIASFKAEEAGKE